MSASRPKLLFPIIALVVAFIVAAWGVFLTVTSNATLNAALTSGTGTAAEVYGAQANIQIGAAVLTAGLVGIVLALVAFGIAVALAAVANAHSTVVVEEFEDFDDEDLLDEDDFEEGSTVPTVPAAAAAPVAEPEATDVPVADVAPEAEAPAKPADDKA